MCKQTTCMIKCLKKAKKCSHSRLRDNILFDVNVSQITPIYQITHIDDNRVEIRTIRNKCVLFDIK